METMYFPEIPEEVFAFRELSEDPTYPYIPRGSRMQLIQAGMDTGKRMAEKYRGADMEKLLAEDGVAIYRFSEPAPMGMHAQIQYGAGEKRVDLFAATAGELAHTMENTPYPLGSDDFMRLFLAHEFFHWLEYSGRTEMRAGIQPLQRKLLGIIPHKFVPCRISEIAAHAFTSAICGIPFDSRLPDYLLMYAHMGKSRAEAYEELRTMEEQYRAECL